MLEVIGTALVGLVERELVKHEPEIEAMVIQQLENLGNILLQFVNEKLSAAAAKPVEATQISQDVKE